LPEAELLIWTLAEIYGLTTGDPQLAVEYGAAHGALAMTTPGDTSMVSLSEVEKVMKGGGARVQR
jgi:2-dehydro-3-deoxygluconokinase